MTDREIKLHLQDKADAAEELAGRMIRERDEALAEVARLRGVLRQVQWGNVANVPGGDPYYLCPLCDQIEMHGHSPDCLVGMALEPRS